MREHLRTFYAAVEHGFEGASLPDFVREDLEGYVNCGVLGRGFAHLQCEDCQRPLLVAFSCGSRGFCPSCLARRAVVRLEPAALEINDDLAARDPVLAQLAAAAVSGLPPAGPELRCRPPVRLARTDSTGPTPVGALVVQELGFNLHAASVAGAEDQAARERLLRYVFRPPLAKERLTLLPDNPVRLDLGIPTLQGPLFRLRTLQGDVARRFQRQADGHRSVRDGRRQDHAEGILWISHRELGGHHHGGTLAGISHTSFRLRRPDGSAGHEPLQGRQLHVAL